MPTPGTPLDLQPFDPGPTPPNPLSTRERGRRGSAPKVSACGKGVAAAALAALTAFVLGLAAVAQSGDVERGRAVYAHWCAPCHAAGPGHPGTQALEAKYSGDIPAVLIEREDLTPEVVATFVRQGVSVMAPFRKTEVSDADLDALAAYLVQAHTEN